jgi:alpha-mannosidase
MACLETHQVSIFSQSFSSHHLTKSLFTVGIDPPDQNRYYTLNTAELAVPNNLAFAVWYDFEILLGMVKVNLARRPSKLWEFHNEVFQDLPSNSQPSSDALYTANKIVNTIRTDKPE